MQNEDHLLKPEQVAERLNVSVDWVRDHSSRKLPRLPVIRLGGGPGRAGLLRYRASEIEKFIEEMERQSGKKRVQ
jgi:Helix-turn-helix domain